LNELKLLFATLLFLLLMPAGSTGSPDMRPEMIRVAVQKGVDSVKLDGNGVLLTDENGVPIRCSFPVQVKKVANGLAVNGKMARALIASAFSVVQVNGKGYRGIVECTPVDRGIVVVNELPLEDYLAGLINCEISSQWPMEAVKAQAVVARTYALYQKNIRKNAPYHLESTVMDQVYEGCDIEDSRAVRGVKETAGQVLTYGGALIQAFYHSSCGGHTEAVENVWGDPLPYLQGVDCKYCLTAPSVRWEQKLPLKRIEAQLKNAGSPVSGLRQIVPGERNRSGRLTELVMVSAKGRLSVSAVSFRKIIGYGVIRSTNFDVKQAGDEVVFSGVGFGHGVGLCQWGAKQRAVDGFDYREILAYYYPGTKLEQIKYD
jgi:stage II sporulation protein D